MKSIKELREWWEELLARCFTKDGYTYIPDITCTNLCCKFNNIILTIEELSPPIFIGEGIGTSDTKGVPTDEENAYLDGWEAFREAVLGEKKEEKHGNNDEG